MMLQTDAVLRARADLAAELERREAFPLLDAWLVPCGNRPVWTREEWIDKFRALGYREDGWVSAPTDQDFMFRGCRFEDREGLSWTPSYSLAAWFARRCDGEVYVVLGIPAERLLARIGPTYADRQTGPAVEFVVDVRGLETRLV
ncbi:hypothetical protein [uncultured Williamsia sp.]|uniref:hypothetical protein n=1 Tax=uncultured Williamsia sp. TaxID=259311 RepID=UPI00263986B2|nr:hypothetical protein [uncultured Williamsia sp.]